MPPLPPVSRRGCQGARLRFKRRGLQYRETDTISIGNGVSWFLIRGTKEGYGIQIRESITRNGEVAVPTCTSGQRLHCRVHRVALPHDSRVVFWLLNRYKAGICLRRLESLLPFCMRSDRWPSTRHVFALRVFTVALIISTFVADIFYLHCCDCNCFCTNRNLLRRSGKQSCSQQMHISRLEFEGFVEALFSCHSYLCASGMTYRGSKLQLELVSTVIDAADLAADQGQENEKVSGKRKKHKSERAKDKRKRERSVNKNKRNKGDKMLLLKDNEDNRRSSNGEIQKGTRCVGRSHQW